MRGRVVLVAGSSGSLGTCFVERLERSGIKYCLIDKYVSGTSIGKNCVSLQEVDLRDEAQTADAISQIFSISSVSHLVNFSGLIHTAMTVDLAGNTLKTRELQDVMDSNFVTAFNLGKHFLKEALKKGEITGLINMSSVNSVGNVGQVCYASAKAAVEAMTFTWAKEFGQFGIRCNVIAPGYIDVESTNRSMGAASKKEIMYRVPMQRLGLAEEVSDAVFFVMHNEYVNGAKIAVDGGLRQ